MRVYSSLHCACPCSSWYCSRSWSWSRQRLATADGRAAASSVQALGASGYSHKHNMNIFQCSKHFDLFIENMRAWHQRERDDSTIYIHIYSICMYVCVCWHAAALIDNRQGASSSTHGFAVINHFYRLLMDSLFYRGSRWSHHFVI